MPTKRTQVTPSEIPQILIFPNRIPNEIIRPYRSIVCAVLKESALNDSIQFMLKILRYYLNCFLSFYPFDVYILLIASYLFLAKEVAKLR